jgi:hypothetical protein
MDHSSSTSKLECSGAEATSHLQRSEEAYTDAQEESGQPADSQVNGHIAVQGCKYLTDIFMCAARPPPRLPQDFPSALV